MRPIDVAWNLLKALPEQQMFYNPTLARFYGDAHGDDIDEGEQERMGTVHPAIQGMLNRRGQPSMEMGRPKITHRFAAFDKNMIDEVPSQYQGPVGFRDTAVRAPPNSSERGLEQLYATGVEPTDENLRLYAENPRFCAWCFDRPEPVIIVSAGHSLWFKKILKLLGIPTKGK